MDEDTEKEEIDETAGGSFGVAGGSPRGLRKPYPCNLPNNVISDFLLTLRERV